MHNRSKSTLFLMEQLIVIATFALCAAACVRILVSSYLMATQARDTRSAIRAAESGAECYKAVSGDLEMFSRVLGGIAVEIDGLNTAVVYYDNNWYVCGETDENAKYRLLLVADTSANHPENLHAGELTVDKLNGEALISLPVAARSIATELAISQQLTRGDQDE